MAVSNMLKSHLADIANGTLLVAVLLATYSSATEQPDLPDGFSLTDPIWLDGEVRSTLCQRLHFHGRPLGLVSHVIPAGDSVVFEECRQYDVGRGGGVGWFLSSPHHTAFRRLDLDGLNAFSSPSACGSRLAYWGSEKIPNDTTYKLYSAYVADVPSGQVRCRHVLGRAWLGTDNTGALPDPRWNEDCSELLMVGVSHFQPLRLALAPPAGESTRSATLGPARVSGSIDTSCTLDPLAVIHVDDDAATRGNGSTFSPLRTISAALRMRKLGDTVHLLPGRYEQPLELVDDVTIRGSGADWTVVAGAAYWGLAVAPFHELGHVPAHVELQGFALEGPVRDSSKDQTPRYPDYDASTLSVLLKIVNLTDSRRYAATRLARQYPGLASMRYIGPGAASGLGDTLLHRVAYKPLEKLSAMMEERYRIHRHIANALIEAGADVNAHGSSAYYAGYGVSGTPLHAAVTRNRLALARLLLDHGADVDALDSAGYTPLARAVDNRDMTDLLLSYGAEHDGDEP